jgi:hypothetical protein
VTFAGPDRILWNERPPARTGGGGGDIDEIVLSGVDIHIEQMDDRCWWIGIYRDASKSGTPYWMGNFVADSRGRMRFVEQENAGIEWDDDKSHEDPPGPLGNGSEGER